MVTVHDDVLGIGAVGRAVVEEDRAVGIPVALVVVIEIILAVHIVALVPEHGVVDFGVVDIDPADDFGVDALQLVPVDTVLHIGSVVILGAVGAVGDTLDFSVELRVLDAEKHHIIEKQSQRRDKDQKGADDDHLSADFLFIVAAQRNEGVDKTRFRRDVVRDTEAVGIIVGGIFIDFGGAHRSKRGYLTEIVAGQLRLRHDRDAHILIDKAVAAIALAEIAQRKDLCLLALQGVFLFQLGELFLVGVLRLSLRERLVAVLPVILGRGYVDGALGGGDGLDKILLEGAFVLGAQGVGDNDHIGLVLRQRDRVERVVDQRRMHDRFLDGVECVAVLGEVKPQLVLAVGQEVLLLLLAYG